MSSQYPVLNNKPIDQWKVTELKDELRRRKITVRGLKEELVRRLADAIRDEEIVKNQEVNEEVQPDHTVSDPNLDVNQAPPGKHTNMISTSPGRTNCEATMTTTDVPDTDLVRDPIGKTDCDVTMTNVDINEEVNIKDSMPNTTDFDVKVLETKSNVVSLEDSATESLNLNTQFESSALVTESKEESQEAVYSDVPCEDTKVSLSESDNQVSVASPNLGSQVKCESIPVDSVSIIEKNKLKDNLNADDFHLEQEVVKPEMVQPSSNYVPSVGAAQKTMDDDKGQDEHLVPLGDIDVDKSTIFDLTKKEDILDEDSPEKLNLDRSSSDELIEEDVMENKHIESSIKSEKLGGKTEAKQESIVGEETNIDVKLGGSIPDQKDIVVEDHSKPTHLTEKRKLEDPVVGINEAPKRQRRWNSETVKVPERQPSNVSMSVTPKTTFQSSPRQGFSKPDTKLIGDSQKERIVPPSQKTATTSLRIDKFLRPFTLKAVQELLAKTGTVCSFWMDHIKTHCYVTYSSVEEANATRNAVYNLQWPPNGGNLLVAEFVDPHEVKARVEAPPQPQTPISPNPTTAKATNFQQPQLAQPPSRQNPLRQQLQPPQPIPATQFDPPSARERLPLPPPASVPEPPPLTLDDLFKKTKANPRIYYLPLSKEEVAAKLATQGKNME